MNDHAASLGMKRSNFAVAHGMHNDNNYSTAADIGRLCCATMQNDMFRSVVKESNHKYHSTVYEGHVYDWENTNILLKQGYTGIKTGITNTAGPCLAASTIMNGYHVVVVVLSCCSMDSRWYEVPKIINWGVKKIDRIRQSKLRPKIKKKILKSITYI
jgi:D-alanyl-D-alanine carboxypeptidase (penicillin-binding protein 5/6)